MGCVKPTSRIRCRTVRATSAMASTNMGTPSSAPAISPRIARRVTSPPAGYELRARVNFSRILPGFADVMRQVVIRRHGAPEVLEVEETSDPVPGNGEVRVRVRAAGVNFADLLARLGLYPDAPKPPLVVGYEVAGYVDAVGAGVAHRRAGDRVVALTRFGGYADVVVVPAGLTFPLPSTLGEAEAAAIPVSYLTALTALYRMANVVAGETVLIHGAGGGVGIAATQLARLRRARIIGTASTGKHDALRSFGVDHIIDYRHADVAAE